MDKGVLIGLYVGTCLLTILCVIPCMVLCFFYCCSPRRLFRFFVWRGAQAAGLIEKSITAGERGHQFRWCYYEGPTTHKHSKPTVLFLHGFSAEKGGTVGFLKYLTPHFHVIAPDMVGHGQTRPEPPGSVDETTLVYHISEQVTRLRAFVVALGLGSSPLHIGGISMGGHIAGVYAAIYSQEIPGHIRSLALHCAHGIDGQPSSFLVDVFMSTKKTRNINNPAPADGVEHKNWLVCRSPEDIKQLTTRLFYKPPWVPSRYYETAHQDKAERADVLNKIMEDLLTPPYSTLLQRHLRHLRMPVFVAWGNNDQIIDVSCVDVLVRELPVVPTVKTYDETGHALLVERVAELGPDHVKWLNEVEERSAHDIRVVSDTSPLLGSGSGSGSGIGSGSSGSGEHKESKEPLVVIDRPVSDDGAGLFPTSSSSR